MNLPQIKKEISRLFNEMDKLALPFVEAEARKILARHSNLDEFIMGMGRWFFTDKKGNHVTDTYGPPVKYVRDSKLANFISEWDELLRITGNPMRFTATGPKITNW